MKPAFSTTRDRLFHRALVAQHLRTARPENRAAAVKAEVDSATQPFALTPLAPVSNRCANHASGPSSGSHGDSVVENANCNCIMTCAIIADSMKNSKVGEAAINDKPCGIARDAPLSSSRGLFVQRARAWQPVASGQNDLTLRSLRRRRNEQIRCR
jgi:hypothetical protein